MATSLETIREIVLKWRLLNFITYNIAKMEAILFSKASSQKAKEEVAVSRLVFRGQEFGFNDRATKWCGVWLDSQLTFGHHIK